MGHLRLAAEGTSARIDEIVRLIRQGILKAVSVGFSPKAKEPLKRSDGTPVPGGIHLP
jgi:phage head maturation protease